MPAAKTGQEKLMPMFHFHLNDGLTVVRDVEGSELADLAEARAEARADCRAHAIAQLTIGCPFPLWVAIVVCNPQGDALHIEWCWDLIPDTALKGRCRCAARVVWPAIDPTRH